jgi:betaine-aldehyde dehydrogenase
VLKPSEITPITALELASICTTVGIPNGVLNVITGLGPDAGTPLSTHSGSPITFFLLLLFSYPNRAFKIDVDKLAFTGSVTTGSRVAEAGAKSVKNVSLELGGKSPVVVFEDVDIDAVVDWIMLGIFFNSGQVCSATSRLLVQSSIKDKLLEQLVKQAKNIKVGDGLHEATLMGPIVNETQYKKVLNYINQGVQEGPQISLCLIPTQPDAPLSCY